MDFINNEYTYFLKLGPCKKTPIQSIGFGQKSYVIFPPAGAL